MRKSWPTYAQILAYLCVNNFSNPPSCTQAICQPSGDLFTDLVLESNFEKEMCVIRIPLSLIS